jgi:ribosomal protein S18 acetylase RimI-like enzyme
MTKIGDVAPQADGAVKIRPVRAADMPRVVDLDKRVTGLAKSDYWQDVFARYGKRRLPERFFLVADGPKGAGEPILGFIIGEVRAWEFGSAPCGWVFGLAVDPEARVRGIGRAMLRAIAAEFRQAGVDKMRTMVARDDLLPLRFFRSEGMMAGPYIQLEMDIE